MVMTAIILLTVELSGTELTQISFIEKLLPVFLRAVFIISSNLTKRIIQNIIKPLAHMIIGYPQKVVENHGKRIAQAY